MPSYAEKRIQINSPSIQTVLREPIFDVVEMKPVRGGPIGLPAGIARRVQPQSCRTVGAAGGRVRTPGETDGTADAGRKRQEIGWNGRGRYRGR